RTAGPRSAYATPGDGWPPRRAGDHDSMLGHSREIARRRDVRDEPHDREAQGRGDTGRRALHAAALRDGLRDGANAGRSGPGRWRHVREWRREALPPALRKVLRA